MIKAGELDRIVTLLEMTSTEDDVGDQIDLWTVVAEVRAAKKALSSRDVMRTQGVVNAPQGKFVIRWRDGVTTKQRIIYDEQQFDIESIEELGRKQGLVIYVRAA